MKSKGLRISLISVVLFALSVTLFHYKVHFNWTLFWFQLRQVASVRVGLAVFLVYLSVSLRAWRWGVLLEPTKQVNPVDLIGPQFIGFTCVALFGSLGDLVRPYLLARTAKLTVSSQIATYTIERMFDVGAAALIFSGALAFAPKGSGTLHREIFIHVGISSFGATMTLLSLALGIRRFGGHLADWTERQQRWLTPQLSQTTATRIRSFRQGLFTIPSILEFLKVLGFSLLIWGLVALAYVQVVHSFTQTPQLANLNFSGTMLLLAASIGGSLVQLPVIGWFTQIAATAATMHAVLAVPSEAATACGALLLGVTFLFLIPGGLLFAHFTRVSLKTVMKAGQVLGSVQHTHEGPPHSRPGSPGGTTMPLQS